METNLSVLFKDVVKEVVLGNAKLFIRVIDDTARMERDAIALNAIREMRRQLHDENSNEYNLYIAPALAGTKEELIATLKAGETRQLAQRSLIEIQPRFIPEPPAEDNPDTAARVAVLEERVEAQQEASEKREKWVNEQLEAFVEEMGDLTDEELVEKVRENMINVYLDRYYDIAFVLATIYLSTYRDREAKQRLFSSLAEVRNLHPKVQDRLGQAIIEHERVDPFLVEDASLGRTAIGVVPGSGNGETPVVAESGDSAGVAVVPDPSPELREASGVNLRKGGHRASRRS